jgi:CelD/BcsL family acetyltransferase involved in cellulose biosynthesis
MLAIRVITDEAALRTLEPQWNRLLQASGSDSFFLTWEWIDSWWEVYGRAGRHRLLVLVAEEEGAIVGVAPLMVTPVGPLGVQRELGFIGQGVDVRPEYIDFFVRPGREAEVTAAFCTELTGPLCGRWDTLRLETVLTSSPNLPVLEDHLAARQVLLRRSAVMPSRYAELRGAWEDFIKGKSTHFRKRWNNTRNRLLRDGEVSYRFAPVDVSVDEAFDELVRLNHERWGDQGTSFRSESYIRLHRQLCQRIAPRGWLMLVLMMQQGKVVAVKYDFVYNGKLWGNQGGWSVDFQQKKVGEILIGRLIEWGLERGLREYDFLGGEAEYKERWGTGVREMVDLDAFNATARGRGLQLARRGKELLKERVPTETWERIKALRDKLPF